MTDEADDMVDLEELVGSVLDKRGLTAERISALDGIAGMKDEILSAFKTSGGNPSTGTSTAASFDEEGFLKKVSDLVDAKVGSATAPSTPPLRRWLGLA